MATVADIVLKADDVRQLFRLQRHLRDQLKELKRDIREVNNKISAARLIDADAVTEIELEGFGKS